MGVIPEEGEEQEPQPQEQEEEPTPSTSSGGASKKKGKRPGGTDVGEVLMEMMKDARARDLEIQARVSI